MRRMRKMRKSIQRQLYKGYLKTIAISPTSASYELVGRTTHRIRAASQRLTIIAGALWVKLGDQKMLLRAGEQIRLEKAQVVALSPVNNDTAFYKVTHGKELSEA